MLLILGCGRLGRLVAQAWTGGPILGVRRGAAEGDAPVAGLTLLSGDISDPALWDALPAAAARAGARWPATAVLLAATPGLRRGVDNGLRQAARLIAERLGAARAVYSGTCAVYADSGGALVDEAYALATQDPPIAALVEIEANLGAHADALTVRLPAIVGAARTRPLEQLRAGQVRGNLDHPFSFIHERDAAELLVEALMGGLGRGVLNAASPLPMTRRQFYGALAAAHGLSAPAGDAARGISRDIDASRLWARLPTRRWRGPHEP